MRQGQGLGAAIGAASSGLLYDLTHDYNTGFMIYSCFIMLGAALFWLIPEIRQPN